MVSLIETPDPDLEKVRTLVKKLSMYYWSKNLPHTCVLPDGTGAGRLANTDMAAFNVSWCYVKPTDILSHFNCTLLFSSLKLRLDATYGNVKVRDAVMFLSKEALNMYLFKYKSQIPSDLCNMIEVANADRCKH